MHSLLPLFRTIHRKRSSCDPLLRVSKAIIDRLQHIVFILLMKHPKASSINHQNPFFPPLLLQLSLSPLSQYADAYLCFEVYLLPLPNRLYYWCSKDAAISTTATSNLVNSARRNPRSSAERSSTTKPKWPPPLNKNHTNFRRCKQNSTIISTSLSLSIFHSSHKYKVPVYEYEKPSKNNN